jgi:hypothetical protein
MGKKAHARRVNRGPWECLYFHRHNGDATLGKSFTA